MSSGLAGCAGRRLPVGALSGCLCRVAQGLCGCYIKGCDERLFIWPRDRDLRYQDTDAAGGMRSNAFSGSGFGLRV